MYHGIEVYHGICCTTVNYYVSVPWYKVYHGIKCTMVVRTAVALLRLLLRLLLSFARMDRCVEVSVVVSARTAASFAVSCGRRDGTLPVRASTSFGWRDSLPHGPPVISLFALLPTHLVRRSPNGEKTFAPSLSVLLPPR